MTALSLVTLHAEVCRDAITQQFVADGLMDTDGYLTPAGQEYVGRLLERIAPYQRAVTWGKNNSGNHRGYGRKHA